MAQRLATLIPAYQNIRANEQQKQLMDMQLQQARQRASQQEGMQQRQQSLQGLMQANPDMAPEDFQRYYEQLYPEQRYQRMLAERARTGSQGDMEYKNARLAEMTADRLRKEKAAQSLADYRKFKMEMGNKKFERLGIQDEEQKKQFYDRLKFQKETHDYRIKKDEEDRKLMLAKPKREFDFEQGNLKQQLPKYLSEKIVKDRVFTQARINDINDSNDAYGDIFKKVDDLYNMIGTEEKFLSAKGFGETAATINSQVAQIITDYNRYVAELGALAGQDLFILEKAIPSPAAIKLMPYSAWKKTISNVKNNIKRKYKNKMNNSGISVTGDELLINYNPGVELDDSDMGLIRR
jgi:hypothetical protein